MNGKSIDSILIDVLCGTGTRYLGVFARDRIPSNLTHFPCAYVANTDINALPGKHWVAFYHESPTHLEFFDSYGEPPETYDFSISPYITTLYYNSFPLQGLHSSVCGQHCIFYLYQRSRRISLRSNLIALSRTANPDLFVRTFVSRLQAKSTLTSFHCSYSNQISLIKQ